MFQTSGTVTRFNDDIIVFQGGLDATGGQSGSPIIHNGAVVGVYTSDNGVANFAARISGPTLADLDLWRSSNDPSPGSDFVLGGPWGERWEGLAGNDTILGMDGNDTILGGAGDDDVNGNRGNDLVDGGPGRDFVRGGQGNDLVYGGEGDDWHVNGNMGADTVYGGPGNDNLFGGPDDDLLFGEAGDDVLSGDLGNDTLYGGPGRDLFTHSPGHDVVADFTPGEDVIRIPEGAMIETVGPDTRITYEGGSLLILGVGTINPSDLWWS